MPVPEKRSFNQAYADARKNQQLEFEWNGKTYETRLKEESPRLWLNRMYRDRFFPTLSDQVHNSAIESMLNTLDRFTPRNEWGLSPSKSSYLAQINTNLSPEHQLTPADFDNWDPYGIKTRSWELTKDTYFDKLDLSMLSADQKRNWLMTATNRKYSDNPYPLTMEKLRTWDPSGSRSEELIRGVTPNGLHELYGKDWLHYNLASALNANLKASDPEFSKDFQFDPAKFAKYDPDGRIAAGYMLYGNPIPEEGLPSQVQNDEFDVWRQHFENAVTAAENYPTNTGGVSMKELDWTDDSPTYAMETFLDPVFREKSENADAFVARDPLAAKYAKYNNINPRQFVWDNYQHGLKMSRKVPLELLLGMYLVPTIFKGIPKLDNFVTTKLLNWGSKFLNYSKMPRLVNAIGQYGILNGAFDAAFLGGAIHNHIKNPNASWSDMAWSLAPFALMTKPVRTGLSWLGSTLAKGWKNPYIKGTVLTGTAIGAGKGLTDYYKNTFKPAMDANRIRRNSMINAYWQSVTPPNNSVSTNQYLSTPQLPEFKFNTPTFNSEK